MIWGEKETAPRLASCASFPGRYRKQSLLQKAPTKAEVNLLHSFWVAPVTFQVPKKYEMCKIPG